MTQDLQEHPPEQRPAPAPKPERPAPPRWACWHLPRGAERWHQAGPARSYARGIALLRLGGRGPGLFLVRPAGGPEPGPPRSGAGEGA